MPEKDWEFDMAIRYNEEKKVFSLHTKNTTYQMCVGKYGFLLHLYYGKRTEGSMDYLLTYADRGFSGNPYDAGTDRTFSMDALPQEFPTQGNGDFRTSCLVVKNSDGTYSCDLRYKEHRILKGKYAIPALPAVYADENEADTLEIVMEDAVTGIEATLCYGILEEMDVITRSVKIVNGGKGDISLEKVQSACLDFMDGGYDFIHFHGRHGMERVMQRTKSMHGLQSIGSRRGTSSHQHNPFMMVAAEATTEETGDCYGLSLMYSGSFKGEVELDQYNQTRVTIGIQDEMFSYPLAPQEAFYAPEVILSYSEAGFGRLSRNYHNVIRYHVCRGKYKDQQRPVLINNWEATYFDFNDEKIYSIAEQASELGVEMLVLDDGWFGKRDNDYSGLGDWFVNEKKMGGELKGLVEKINALGMKFGIWIEPEMVSEDSELYRKHPDWAFVIPGRRPVRGRSQLVLDFSRKEVVDGIFGQICEVLDGVNVEYIKIDMNRSITDVYSATAGDKNQGAVLYRYVLGVYDFLERLAARYPDMLIEGCSGGGGRFDAGMLYYSPQIWCSDNTDAIERLYIQYGTSFGYPVSSVGSHVSAVPNHQTGRSTSMKTRGVVAMAGSFGYELDLNKISEEEKQMVREQIKEYHNYWNMIHNGNYYRLTDPAIHGEIAAWEFAAADAGEALLNVVTIDTHCNASVQYVKLKGLAPEKVYRIEGEEGIYSGDALMNAGIPVPYMSDEYEAWQVHFIEA